MALKNWYIIAESGMHGRHDWVEGCCGCSIGYCGNNQNQSLALAIEHCLNRHEELENFKVKRNADGTAAVWVC